jgi:hypothetical protein
MRPWDTAQSSLFGNKVYDTNWFRDAPAEETSHLESQRDGIKNSIDNDRNFSSPAIVSLKDRCAPTSLSANFIALVFQSSVNCILID